VGDPHTGPTQYIAGTDAHVAYLSNIHGVVEAVDGVFGLLGVGFGVELQEKAGGDEGGFEKGIGDEDILDMSEESAME
jgi:hypothetical protein